jgi:hypothetical protein
MTIKYHFKDGNTVYYSKDLKVLGGEITPESYSLW